MCSGVRDNLTADGRGARGPNVQSSSVSGLRESVGGQAFESNGNAALINCQDGRHVYDRDIKIKCRLFRFSQDLSFQLLPSLFPSILQGLQDVDDDVRAVAAAALLPVSGDLSTLIPDKVRVQMFVAVWYYQIIFFFRFLILFKFSGTLF